MYEEVWEAAIGEVFECHREPTNATDRYAVAVTKAATINESSNYHRTSNKKALEGTCMLPVLTKRRLDTFYSDKT